MISERVRFILEDLEQTQLQFIRKHKITQDEYRCATDTLVGSVAAGEGSLLYDVIRPKKKRRCPRPNTKSDFMRITAGLVRLAVCDERHFKSRAFLNRIRMETPIDGTSITLHAEGRTVSSGSATVQHVGTEKTGLSD